MVRGEQTGLMIGSMVERRSPDPSFYRNGKLKLWCAIPQAMLLRHGRLHGACPRGPSSVSYIPVDGDDVGLLLDVNVVYSGVVYGGQVQQRLIEQYAFLDAAAGPWFSIAAPLGHPEEEAEREERRRPRDFRDTSQTRVAVYAEGRNVGQSEVSDAVRERLVCVPSGIL